MSEMEASVRAGRKAWIISTLSYFLSPSLTLPTLTALAAADHPNLAKQATWGCSKCSKKNWDQPTLEAVCPGVL
ncbi:MTFR1L isoform 14 [Pongo abelii]|uniref:MTFR1L isoform 14 n=1 Tax=Pongo abelii TaxID=9601 RepID=A0A2J8SIN6_PONAB|nr:MTFR1L isoform 14 [Pongo abelii]